MTDPTPTPSPTPPTGPLRLLVTGASGNVGTALLRALAADNPDHDIIGVVRRTPPAVAPYDRVIWHELDLAGPHAADELAPLMAGVDAVVHLAWGFQPSRDENYLRRTAVGGTQAVIAAVERAGVPHLAHMSSVGAYSPAVDRSRVDESYPVHGVPTSPYSQHKATAERLLDAVEARNGEELTVTRLRPGFVLQRDAASGLLRYGLPGYLPAAVLRLLKVLPVDRTLLIPVVHADDVAEAILRSLRTPVGGAFNLAAEPPLDRDAIAAAFGAHPVHVPAKVLSTLVGLTWRARVQALEPGWVDLGFSVPQMNTTRARELLGWEPRVDAHTALAETLAGALAGASTPSPPLRPRSAGDLLRRLTRSGPVGDRHHT
jgi:UDP-glucose 4-epimerase